MSNSESTWTTRRFESPVLNIDEGETVADRQERLPGFSTRRLQESRVLLIGAGGLNSAIAGPLIRKGIGWLEICDGDVVEVSNLNRQHFYPDDLYRPKAHRLAANAAREGQGGASVLGHYTNFDEQSAQLLMQGADVVVCGVDNNITRANAARYGRIFGVPVIFSAVSETADYGWVFVQDPEGSCVGCVFPRIAAAGIERQPCRAVPATADILHVLGGIVLYSIDSVLMNRPRAWNFRSVHLVGTSADVIDRVKPRAGCLLCNAETKETSP
jgi:molybdopterin/thiamine biosynthesis adenylyltransferase